MLPARDELHFKIHFDFEPGRIVCVLHRQMCIFGGYCFVTRWLHSEFFMNTVILPSRHYYKTHFNRPLNCWTLRCCWSKACRLCSNCIFILHLTLGCNILRKENCKPRRETSRFSDLVRFIENLRYYLIWTTRKHECVCCENLWENGGAESGSYWNKCCILYMSAQ